MSRLHCTSTRVCTMLLFLLVSVCAARELTSAAELDKQNTITEDLKPSRLLRIHASAESNEAGDEDRAIKDLVKNLKNLVKNTQVKDWELRVDARNVKTAKRLYANGASFQAYLKANITPEQLYKALNLQKEMRRTFKFAGYKAKLLNNPKYIFWRKYEKIWAQANIKVM